MQSSKDISNMNLQEDWLNSVLRTEKSIVDTNKVALIMDEYARISVWGCNFEWISPV
jgi:hypothetical protein